MKVELKYCLAIFFYLIHFGCKDNRVDNHEESIEEAVEEMERLEMEESANEDISEIPSFEVPPPSPSSSISLNNYFNFYNSSLGEINNLLRFVLEKNGYERISYFKTQNGFALATQFERIDDKGNIIKEKRWDTSISGNYIIKNFMDYLKLLIFETPGYYRCTVFLITTTNYNYDKEPSEETVKFWIENGKVKLPDYIKEMKFTKNHIFSVLIYEFQRPENEEDGFLIKPGKNSAGQYLKSINFKDLAKEHGY